MKTTILKSIILSLVLITGVNAACAGAGIFYGQINLSKNGEEYVAHTEDYSQPFDLGGVSGLSLNATYTKVCKDYGYGNICSAVLYYKLYSSSKEVIGETPVTTSWSKDIPNSKDSEWKKEGINVNLIQNLTPHERYTLEFWFKATGSSSNSNNCNEEFWLSNDGGNYKVNFTYTPYNVTLKADSHGTYSVSYGSKIATSKLDEDVVIAVPANTSIRISTNTPKTGYAQTNGAAIQYDGGNRVAAKLNTDITITGNATITGNFVSAQDQKVYLQQNVWDAKDVAEEYYAYVYHDTGNAWIKNDAAVKDNFGTANEYEFTIPAGYHSVIFCRVNPEGTNQDPWQNVWNQTNDLLMPVGQAANCCKITKMGEIPTGGTKPSNCESVWKLRTYYVTVYAAGFGEHGFVYDNMMYMSKVSEDVVYEVPQGATIKLVSTPYSDAYNSDIMTNVGGVQSESKSGESIQITNTTKLDDNYKTIGAHVVYLASPSGGQWNNNDNKNKITCLYATHDRTNLYKDAKCVEMTKVGEIVEGSTRYYYYRCEVPAGYNKIRFEKRADVSTFATGDLKSETLKYEIPLNSVSCFKLNDIVNSEFVGAWESTPGFNGDWRLSYIKAAGKEYPSDIVRAGTASQIVSLHVNPVDAGADFPKLELQKHNGTSWVVQETKLVKDIATITNDSYERGRGVWNFVVENNGSAMTVDYDAAERYTGNYYIRTNNAEGGWRNYTLSTNKMTYSSYAKAHDHYTHYYCRWVGIEWLNQAKGESSKLPGKNNNVKFIVANDYSAVISNELAGDSHTGTGGVLPESANVRWTWDERTNEVERAYILGSSEEVDHIVLDYKKSTNANYMKDKLADRENWIYEFELTDVVSGSHVNSLTARYPSKETNVVVTVGGTTQTETIQPYTQTFISDKNMITSGNQTPHNVRVMYDFKTNQTSVMLIPDATDVGVGIDVLIERQDQADATQVSSTINAANDEGYTVYAAMTFTKEHILNDALTAWNRLYYWISFPFDVKISDVFGFGEYGKQWIIQYYDGAARAKNGYYLESPTYWRWISDTTYKANRELEDKNGNPCNGVMVANRGYILQLAGNVVNEATFQHNSEYVRLYFPSMCKIKRIDGSMQNVTELLQPYTCTISGREDYDSNWHMIGIPSYANKTVNVTQKDLFFFYEYNSSNNTYTPQSSEVLPAAGDKTFKSMHSYMVQYAGEINWSATTSFEPKQLAARRDADYEEKVYNLGLQLLQNDQILDQTFIRMQEDNATADFDMNLDLTKIINSGANIYSLAGANRVELAGNVLPVEDVVVPLGVVCTKAGSYTFSMPAGTDGAVVELIDYETNTRTNLLLSDYTVNIPTGTHTNRFALSIKQSENATGIESTDDSAADFKKYIINGQLIIQHDGQLYNAMGEKL